MQGQFLEETIRSILLQGYPNLEYFVMDGGSTDESVEIIKKYSRWIRYWVSERDGGQSAAINRGLRMGSGALATWINSDDMLCKSALSSHFLTQPSAQDVVYVGDCVYIDQDGSLLFVHRGRVTSFEDLVRVRTVWHSGGCIDQPAVLFPLQLAWDVGGLSETNHLTMDYELWGRFLLAGAKLQYTQIPFGFFRRHEQQKTNNQLKQTKSMIDAAARLVTSADFLPPETKQQLLSDLGAYWAAYPERVWKQSGRLARMGLPRSIVDPLRDLRERVESTMQYIKRFAEGSRQ